MSRKDSLTALATAVFENCTGGRNDIDGKTVSTSSALHMRNERHTRKGQVSTHRPSTLSNPFLQLEALSSSEGLSA